MNPRNNLPVRTWMAGIAGAAMLLIGVGVSVYAAQPATEAPALGPSGCGSVDPGFAYDLEDTLRGREGSIDPGFAPQPNEVGESTIDRPIDPGFSQPIDSCPMERLQDLLTAPDAARLGFDPALVATPTGNR